jgi:tetratricopeptide (TPR) repeat protein
MPWVWKHGAVACLVVSLAACAAALPPKETPQSSKVIKQNSDDKEVADGISMIKAGKMQAAIDGPLADVANRLERQYANSPDQIYSPRGPALTADYAGLAVGDKKHPGHGKRIINIGPAWGMAYWARGYAYGDMGRYPEAETELSKALALSPKDSQYLGELAYVNQRQGRYDDSFKLYRAAIRNIDLMDTWPDAEKNEFLCRAYGGQGFDMAQLKRYDEAEKAYGACLRLMPNDAKSKAGMEGIRGLKVPVGGKAVGGGNAAGVGK